jgi:death-on-curing protein
MVLGIHDEAIYYFGGNPGVRDLGLLESALDRPRNRRAYGSDADIFLLAASLCVGIAKNHPFVDGNKRTALLATRAFLFLNDQRLEPPEADEVVTMVGLAAGELSEAQMADWLRSYSTSIRKKTRSTRPPRR